MKKAMTFVIILFSLFISGIVLDETRAATSEASLSVDVGIAVSVDVTGDTVSFGDLTPGTPRKGSGGTAVTVTTSAANGYQLAISDGISGSNSSLLHSDASTRISDYAGTIATPTLWSGTGLGFSLYQGTNKDVKWGTGTTYDDSNNKYAAVPTNSTVIMNKTGYSALPDTAYIGWQVDVPNNQKTGSYSGAVTITVTGIVD